MKIICTLLFIVLVAGSIYIYQNGSISPIETVRQDSFPHEVSNTLYKVQLFQTYTPVSSDTFIDIPGSSLTFQKVAGRTFVFHTYIVQNVAHTVIYEKKGNATLQLFESTDTIYMYKDTSGFVFAIENGQFGKNIYVVKNTTFERIPETKAYIKVCNQTVCRSKEFEQIEY